MTTSRRGQSEALFSELRSVLVEIREAEAEAADPGQAGPSEAELPVLLESLRSLRERCSARALLYARAAELIDRQVALWSPRGQSKAMCGCRKRLARWSALAKGMR
jgi:hypothetical protein